MKKVVSVVLPFSILFTPMLGQGIDIQGKDYVCVHFALKRPSNWPMFFSVAVNSNDTLRVDTTSVDDCVQKARETYISLALSDMEGRDLFCQIWGNYPHVINAYTLFMCDYNSETEQNSTKKTFHFSTGEILTLEYSRVLGLVVEREDTLSYLTKTDSDGYPVPRKWWIPVSLLSCEKYEDFQIVVE